MDRGTQLQIRSDQRAWNEVAHTPWSVSHRQVEGTSAVTLLFNGPKCNGNSPLMDQNTCSLHFISSVFLMMKMIDETCWSLGMCYCWVQLYQDISLNHAPEKWKKVPCKILTSRAQSQLVRYMWNTYVEHIWQNIGDRRTHSITHVAQLLIKHHKDYIHFTFRYIINWLGWV